MTRLSATARKAASARQAGAGLATSSLRSLQGEGTPGENTTPTTNLWPREMERGGAREGGGEGACARSVMSYRWFPCLGSKYVCSCCSVMAQASLARGIFCLSVWRECSLEYCAALSSGRLLLLPQLRAPLKDCSVRWHSTAWLKETGCKDHSAHRR